MEQSTVEWTPKNGERVWVKVFSNWSLGTYIGFDTIESKHLVREDNEGGGHLMASSQVLPESANPNIPKQLTPVEWFAEALNEWRTKNIGEHSVIGISSEIFEQAKEMEKEQKISLLEWIRNNAVEVQGGWQYDNWTYTDKGILEVYYKQSKQQEQ